MRTKFVSLWVATAALALFVSTETQAQTTPESVVRVSVANVRAQQGFIMIALYDEANWGQAAVARARVPVTSDPLGLTLIAPAPGRYAIRMFQDLDGDGRMSTGMLGMPLEPVGFSNDAPISFGPPTFEAAAFAVNAEGAALTITLR